MVKFSEEFCLTWIDIMPADDLFNGILLNSVLLTFEEDYHLQ